MHRRDGGRQPAHSATTIDSALQLASYDPSEPGSWGSRSETRAGPRRGARSRSRLEAPPGSSPRRTSGSPTRAPTVPLEARSRRGLDRSLRRHPQR
jgi:hypothetical protein